MTESKRSSIVGAYARGLDFVSMLLEGAGGALEGLQLAVKLKRYRLTYDSRPDDIFIVTYPKSGTTWLQMILYQLTTDGEMDFPHINTKSPHFEEEFIYRNTRFEDLESPRILKSHLPYSRIPRGRGKYIYVMRNGLDVAVSYYHHYQSYHGFPGSFEDFFGRFVEGKVEYGSWFEHLSGWLPNTAGLDVLFLRFEDLLSDLEAAVEQIAEFCGIEVGPADMPRIVERCRFDFMKRHEEKFDLAYGIITIHGFALDKFMRKGGAGGWREYLDGDQQRVYARHFEKRLRGLGLEDYHPLPGSGPAPPGA